MNIHEKEMTFLDHLEELRWHLIRAAIVVLVFMILSFVFIKWIFNNIIFAPASPNFPTFQWLCHIGNLIGIEQLCITEIPMEIQSRLITGQFQMALVSSFILGLIISFPYVAWETWRFIRPGLHVNERKYSRGAVAAISILFFLGVGFGYYVLSPLAVYFFSTFQISEVVMNEFDITSFVSTVATLVFGSGLLFQLPVVIYFLTKIGIVTPKLLKAYRKHAIVVILIISAIITPPDPISQTLISIPLFLLYELGIIVSGTVTKKQILEDETN